MTLQISGSGGKSGAGGGGISEDPDTLSGVTRARYIDLLGEGPIGGLVNGEASIYLDGVPLRDLKGTPNYKPFKWTSTLGTSDQLPIPGFSGTSSEVGVGVNLTVSAGTIIRSISDGDADAVRVNVSVTGLSSTDSAGKISATTVAYIIRARRSGGAWVDLKTVTITGKTGARYPKSDEVLLTGFSGTGAFEVSVTRTTPDSASGLLVNGLHWDSFTVINYEQYAYPHSALLALELDARYFSQIPARTYHLRGLLVRVPDNYDPLTRTYTGVWRGRGFWKLAYTNNPAWCYFDLITNRRYGLGRRISDDQVDVWGLYTIGKYCDEIVPTGGTSNISDIIGTGGVSSDGTVVIGAPIRGSSGEPRFTLNCVINTVDDAYLVLNQLSTAFRGMTYWGASGVAFTQDRPTTVSMLWNNANVIDGKFSYAGSSKANRHTSISVAWNDPSEDFRQRFEYVEDREGIARYGVRATDIVAFGCTSRSQARRWGLEILYTERMETDVITFRAGLDSSQVRPGDTGEILDSKRVGLRWGGRIAASTLTSVTLDASVTLALGTYTLAIVDKDGTIVTRSVVISTAGIYATLTLTIALAAVPAAMAMWVLSSTAVSPVTVRVINVRQVDAATYEFAVLRHNPKKYNAIDLGAKLAVPSYTALKRGELPAVTGLVAVENTYRLATAAAAKSYLQVSWDHGVVGLVGGVSVVTKDLLTRGYNLVITKVGETPFTILEQSDSTYTYADIAPGTYTVTVRPVSYLGVVGANAATVTRVVTGIDSIPPENVQGLTCTILTGGPRFAWTRPVDLSYRQTEIHIEAVWNNATTPLFVGDANDYTWNWPAAGSYRAVVKHRDTAGNMSVTAASVDFTIDANIQSDFLTWVGRGVTVQGRNLTKVGGVSAWDADAYTTDAFAGGAYAAATVTSITGFAMFGLNNDPLLDRAYSSLDYAAYAAAGNLYYWKNNAQIGGSIAALVVGDKLAVSYDGANVRIYLNGVVVYTDPVIDTNKLSFDCSINSPGMSWSGVQFGPLTGIAGVTAAAAAAQTSANTANTAITNIASDSILSPGEKPAIVQDYAVITGEQAGIDAQATAYSITTEKTTYDTAVSALTTYLGTLSGWNTVPGSDVAIVNTTFRTKFSDVYTTRQALLNKIAEVAGTRATWSTGLSGKPADTDLLNTHTQGSVLVVNHPGGGNAGFNANNQPGAIKIRLPQSWTNTMLRFFVEVYEYTSNKSFTLEVGGYTNGGPGWLNAYAKMTGSAAAEKTVWFGHDGTKCCVWIGEPGSIWEYPQITVTNFRAGYNAYSAAAWSSGWQVTLDTSLHSGHAITASEPTPLTGASWSQIPTGTGKAADNATVGATWGSNLTGQPADSALLNALQTWAQVSGTGRPADNASNDFPGTLRTISTGTASLVGNTATKTGGGSAYNAKVASSAGYTDGCFVSGESVGTTYTMIGLSTDPSVFTYVNQRFHVEVGSSGVVNVYELGSQTFISGAGTASVGDVFTIAYDGVNARYSRNGTVFKTTPATITGPLYMDNYLYAVGDSTRNMRFGPMSNNDWSATGGIGRPDDFATKGARAGANLLDASGVSLGDADVKNSYAVSGQNRLANSDQTTCGFRRYHTPNGAVFSQDPVIADGSNGWTTANYVLSAGQTRGVWLRQDGRNTSAADPRTLNGNGLAADFHYGLNGEANGAVACVPNERIVGSVYMQAHRCDIQVHLVFYSEVGATITYPFTAQVAPGGASNTLNAMPRVSVVAVAPPGTASVGMMVRKFDTWAGNTDSYLWLAAPMIEAVSANVSTPSPYQPGPASSTRQLGYSGDLNATVGATWGSNLTGQPANSALLNALQTWAEVSGAGRPADNATVGATFGVNVFGQADTPNIVDNAVSTNWTLLSAEGVGYRNPAYL